MRILTIYKIAQAFIPQQEEDDSPYLPPWRRKFKDRRMIFNEPVDIPAVSWGPKNSPDLTDTTTVGLGQELGYPVESAW